METTKFRTFLDSIVFNQANILLNPRYLDMEKFRTVVLEQFNSFVRSEQEHLGQQHTNSIVMVVSEEKDDANDDEHIDVSVCGDVPENTKKSAYVLIRGRNVHWSDAALMSSKELSKLVKRYNKEYPCNAVPKNLRKSHKDVITHIWGVKCL